MSANWYYTKNKEREGPVTPAQLKQLASKGWLAPATLAAPHRSVSDAEARGRRRRAGRRLPDAS